jgi:hypothetical protein
VAAEEAAALAAQAEAGTESIEEAAEGLAGNDTQVADAAEVELESLSDTEVNREVPDRLAEIIQ